MYIIYLYKKELKEKNNVNNTFKYKLFYFFVFLSVYQVESNRVVSCIISDYDYLSI